jgi:hypothetical protein
MVRLSPFEKNSSRTNFLKNGDRGPPEEDKLLSGASENWADKKCRIRFILNGQVKTLKQNLTEYVLHRHH